MRLSTEEKRILAEMPDNPKICEEYKRLREQYADVTGARLKVVLKLIARAAFMAVTLEELERTIDFSGVVDIYQNGENQSGRKKSVEVDVYNTMAKIYAAVIKQLTELLPKASVAGEDDGFDSFAAGR